MNRKLVEDLYLSATDKCHMGIAWEFETEFVKCIVTECISVIKQNNDDMEFESEQFEELIMNHFGL